MNMNNPTASQPQTPPPVQLPPPLAHALNVLDRSVAMTNQSREQHVACDKALQTVVSCYSDLEAELMRTRLALESLQKVPTPTAE